MTAFALPKYATLTPVYNVKDASAFIAFCVEVMGAEVLSRQPTPDGFVMHADLKFGDCIVMVSDAVREPPSTSLTSLIVADVDGIHDRAVRAGARSVFDPKPTPWGKRWARVVDAWGNGWTFTT
jgi:PhnB protein